MEAYDRMSCSPSTQIITNSQELEDGGADMGLKSSERRVCRIAFEEYLVIWMKIATTNPELLTGSESLDEFIKYTERYAVNYGSASGDKDCLVQMQRNIPVQKLPKKRSRVECMRRLYMQCRAPGDWSCRSDCACPFGDPTSPHLSFCYVYPIRSADPPDSWCCSGFRWAGTLGARNGRTGGMDSFSLFERIG